MWFAHLAARGTLDGVDAWRVEPDNGPELIINSAVEWCDFSIRFATEDGKIGSLGNLLLVNDALNIRLGDKDFESKKRILQSDGLNYDSGGVLDAAEWTKDSIVARTCLLAERA
ncbi:GmrSD restriction endonuclease domain-containing protein [Rathayibacter rathayi]|uniref:GmrSD restriction endonuclease domain-containing protein n=1 Tax=Rathayibacter rathayi TaxID=33887 RepID=UPI000CE81322|nr:DUF1524 domain-containing protein [Rathayibacter rathayi]PPF20727.1 hypothetical protein C5C34_14205 [Rathayibacter rathayi]PPG10741.1 hypothetical protein C5C11_13640 [Rathayibacter rathayi]PPG91913.1 hypothetical protein C5C22_13595 [Rathayibacter rathayi]